MANKNIRSLSSRKGLEDNLFENIAQLSHKKGSKEEFQELSKRFMIDDSVVVGTASFYDFTREENRNKKYAQRQTEKSFPSLAQKTHRRSQSLSPLTALLKPHAYLPYELADFLSQGLAQTRYRLTKQPT